SRQPAILRPGGAEIPRQRVRAARRHRHRAGDLAGGVAARHFGGGAGADPPDLEDAHARPLRPGRGAPQRFASKTTDMTDRFKDYQFLAFDRPAERVLRITINRPEKLNSLPWEAHGELTRVWHDVDQDPDTNVAIIRG